MRLRAFKRRDQAVIRYGSSGGVLSPGMEQMAAEAFYRRYIDRCNAHQFAGLGEFVDDDVRVNDEEMGLDGYIAGLESVGRAFPDFRWDLRHLLVDVPWIAAHFTDTGTHRGTLPGVQATGRAVRIREFALYRLAGNKIAEVWGDLAAVSELARRATPSDSERAD